MDKKQVQAIQETERLIHGNMEQVKWDDLKAFYMVVVSQSFRTAAKNMSLSLNAIRNRVDSLEGTFGEILLIRHPKGIEPTQKGLRLFEVIKRMVEASKDLNGHLFNTDQEVSGNVSISVSEGLGSFWLMPRIRHLRQAYPKLKVRLHCDMRMPDLTVHEADVSIQLERPEHPDLIIQTLGYLHLMPYVSRGYLEQYGEPKIPLSAPHGFVDQIAPQVRNDLLDNYMDANERSPFTVVQTNTSSSHYYAIANGLGIGILPTYSRAVTRKVIPIDLGFPPLRREIYLAYHPQARRVKKMDVVLDWIRDAFDAKKYPWFREDFIHPTELEESLEQDNVVKLFESFEGMIAL